MRELQQIQFDREILHATLGAKIRKFPVFFPVSRELTAGERFAADTIHRQRVLLSLILELFRLEIPRNVETYQKIRASIGEYNFQSQYQQDPMPLAGGLIRREWLQYYSMAAKPEFRMVVQSWDTANKAGEMNDYSVCTTWGLCDGKFYLLHVYRMRLNFPALKRAAKELYENFNPTKVVIEDKASGTALIQELKAEGIYGVELYQPAPGSEKVMRLAGQAIKFEEGRVLLPEEAPWLDEYVRELTGFPGSKFDDQVDSTAQALDFMSSYCRPTIFDRL